jgi:hypothetical protein
MVDSLKGLHLGKKIWLNSKILPPNFPLKLFWLELVVWDSNLLICLFVKCDDLQVIIILLVFLNDYSVAKILQTESFENFIFASC